MSTTLDFLFFLLPFDRFVFLFRLLVVLVLYFLFFTCLRFEILEPFFAETIRREPLLCRDCVERLRFRVL